MALWVIPNIEFFSLDEKVPPGSGGTGAPVPDVPTWSARDYGNRVGVFRLMEVLEKHGIRATVALNSELCTEHPEIIKEGNKLKWEWMGHYESNTRRLNAAPPGEEPRIIKDSLAVIEKATGARPRGWLGSGLQETWDTLDLLADNGCDYVCDWTNDDQPYVMSLEGDKTLVSVPYSHEINDKPAFEKFHRTADEFRDMICRQFDVLYREGAQSGPRDGDRDPPLSHRRAAPDRRVRRSAGLYQPPRQSVEDNWRGYCTSLSRASREAVTIRRSRRICHDGLIVYN